jgi:hypothetical protein
MARIFRVLLQGLVIGIFLFAAWIALAMLGW